MTDTPDDWTDADPADLPERWREGTDDKLDRCDRCGQELATVDGVDPDYCEDCERVVQRRCARISLARSR